MKQKILSIVIVLAAITMLATASATNLTCTPPTPNISVIQGGNTAIVSGNNFKPCHMVNIYLDNVELPYVGGATTPQGSFTAIIVIPNATPLGTHIIKVTDDFGHMATSLLTVISLQGPKGDTGDIGATGAQGVPGEVGATGPIGPEGPKGDTGAIGQTGAAGTPFNATGDILLFNGTIGATGAKGDKGDTGSQGQTGATGARGFTGATGETGEQGRSFTGPAGEDGEDGVTTIVYQGIQTPIVPIEVWGAMLIGAMLLFGVCVLVVFKTKKGAA